MRYMRLAVVLMMGFAAPNVTAQQPGPRGPAAVSAAGEIRGTVLDKESNTPIASASVAVWDKASHKLVAGAIVKDDGSFRIEGLRPGTYNVKITMIGYATQTSEALTISEAAPRALLGKVLLARAAIEITAVTAMAEKAAIIAPDRNSYNAKAVAPAAANASEVLENVPSVNVDADGKVSLRGNENVVIQINGRPTPMSGAQLANYLKQLPANTVERIEVVPNPSAKQDPEGMAGILNIVMKTGVDLGTSGGFTGSGSSMTDRYNVGATLGHQSGPLAFFLNYGYNHDSRNETGENNRTRLRFGSASSYTEQDLDGAAINAGHNLSVNADYTFNKRDVLSTTLQLNRRNASNLSSTVFEELNASRTLLDTYNRLRDQDQKNWFADAALAFKRTYTPQKHELSAEVRFNRQKDRDFMQLARQSIAKAALRTDLENDETDGTGNLVTAQLDLAKMVNKDVKLETGYKMNERSLDRDFTVMKDVAGNGSWVNSGLSNALRFSETTNAAYAVVSKGGKKFDLQAGLRAEYADRTFNLATTNTDYPNRYASLFPSALLNYKMNEKSQTKLSYSRRIRRPGTQELNPFPMFFDVQNVFMGNPDLKPEYTDAIELGYQRSGVLGTLQIAPFYRRTSNIIRVDINTADTIQGREVTSVTFTNLDHSNSWGADVNGQFRFGKKISGLLGLNAFKMVTDGGSTSVMSSNAVSWMGRFNINFALDANTTIIGNAFYRGAMKIEQGRFNAVMGSNFAVRRKLQGDRLAATFRVNDIFNTSHFGVTTGDDNVTQFTTRYFNVRAAYLSVQYNWGKPPRLRQRRQEETPQSSNPFGS